MVSEISPLLEPQRDPDASSIDDTQSKFTLESRVVRGFIQRRFWWLFLLGIAAIVTLQLFFLPRTSPSRDFRRWHELRFTRTDIKRVFLVQSEIGAPGLDGNTVEENMGVWLKQLTAINSRTPAAVAGTAPGASKLTTFVETSMRAMRFSVSSHSYKVSENLHVPNSSALYLIDGKTSRVLYKTPLQEKGSKTPGYFLFGKNGTARARYVYCNNGDPQDFRLLHDNSVSLRGKIAVFAHSHSSDYTLEDKVKLAEMAGCVATVVHGEKDTDRAISRNYKPISPPEQGFRIPVSYHDILPILQTLAPAPKAYPNWSYSPNNTAGPLELVLNSEFAPEHLNATNVVAEIEGVLSDSEIVIGASRDSLTSSNPLSGHAVMLEIMRRLSHLQKLGWKPLRRIRFVSWDASRSGALGSQAIVKDSSVFETNMPVLAYINLDDDVVTGSHFTVDASPLFNHILKNTADLIPFPKDSPYYKRLVKDSALESAKREKVANASGGVDYVNEGSDDDESDTDVSLLRYWTKQNSRYINNKLGHGFAGTDSGTFQLQMDTPVINLRFAPSPKYNDTLYVPESETYSPKWVTELDPNLDFHASLVRFVGLLVLSLSEHEVVDSRTTPYFVRVREYLEEMQAANKGSIDAWSNKTADFAFLKKTALYRDLQEKKDDWGDPVSFHEVLIQLGELVENSVEQARVFDSYNQEVENLWTTDYPWYRMIRKIHIFAKFKVTNYKLLRLEKELGQNVDWLDESQDDDRNHHFMYDVPQGIQSTRNKEIRGAFASLYEAFDEQSMEKVVRLVAAKYERLNAVYKKIR